MNLVCGISVLLLYTGINAKVIIWMYENLKKIKDEWLRIHFCIRFDGANLFFMPSYFCSYYQKCLQKQDFSPGKKKKKK